MTLKQKIKSLKIDYRLNESMGLSFRDKFKALRISIYS
jgi:hypothetical protein